MAQELRRIVLKSIDELKPFFWQRTLPEEKCFEVRFDKAFLEGVLKDGECLCYPVAKTGNRMPWFRISQGVLRPMEVDIVEIDHNVYKLINIISHRDSFGQDNVIYLEPEEADKCGIQTVEFENYNEEET